MINVNDEKMERAMTLHCPLENKNLSEPQLPLEVWLVDDDNEFRGLVADFLNHESGLECSRNFPGPDAALSALASKPGPDVILLDIQMRNRNGLDAIKPIKSLARKTRVIMFTTFYDRERHHRALSEGASGFLLKTTKLKDLVQEIRCPAPATAPFLKPVRLACQPSEPGQAPRSATESSADRANGRGRQKSRSKWINRLKALNWFSA